ncbi:MAG TPA: allophanate hydrolase [Desulfobacteraceae bacterium]|nr:allophanate hydrolase [Desulfobacteraceae bacterium]
MLYQNPEYRIMGDRGLLVELGDDISPEVNQSVRELFITLKGDRIDGVVEITPGYRSLLVIYDPLTIPLTTLRGTIDNIQRTNHHPQFSTPNLIKIPVVYGGKYGPDLEWLAEYHKMTIKEVIRLHTGSTYKVYMVGFMPGFPYMGELPEELATPRRETPRTAVPQGSVGIAQKQTGIYPVEGPGGWRIIGRTPLRLFDPLKSPPTPLKMGGIVCFYTINEEEFSRWKP